jgi:hypothetical protein
MHWFRASMVLLSFAVVALSGCVSPKVALSDLSSGGEGSGFQGQLSGAARIPDVPVVERATTPAATTSSSTTSPAPAEPSDEPAVPAPAEPADEPTTDPPADESADDAAPDEPDDVAEDTPPAQNAGPCEAIRVDDGQILAPRAYAGTVNRDQTVRAEYAIKSSAVIASGIAVGLAHASDFCHLEDAYPCVWSGPVKATAEDPHAEGNLWRQYFGFTNVWSGRDSFTRNGVTYEYTDLVVRSWARLSDGTLVLDNEPHNAYWDFIRVKDETAISGMEEDTSHMCDLVAVGILPG